MIDTQQVSAGYNGKQKRKTHVIFLHRVKFLGILFLPPQNFVSRFKVFLFFFLWVEFFGGGFCVFGRILHFFGRIIWLFSIQRIVFNKLFNLSNAAFGMRARLLTY